MAKYLISFPSVAMNVPDSEREAVGRDAHAVIREAKEAGVYVFGGGIDETVPPVLVGLQNAEGQDLEILAVRARFLAGKAAAALLLCERTFPGRAMVILSSGRNPHHVAYGQPFAA